MKSTTITIVTIMLFALFGFSQAFAQEEGDYRSADSGDWSDPNSWEVYDSGDWTAAGSAPDGSENITIRIDHDISVDVDVDASGHVTVEGEGIDAESPFEGGNLEVADGSLTFIDSGVYEHARDDGSIPSATWEEGSTVMVTGMLGEDPGNANQDFYNVVWNSPDQASNAQVGWGADQNEIFGDVTVISTGSARFHMTWAGRDDEDINIDIAGNLIVEGGQATATGSGGEQTYFVNIGGNVEVHEGGNLAPSRGSGGNTEINVAGDFTVDSGATLQNSNEEDLGGFVFNGSESQNIAVSEDVSYTGAINYTVADGAVANIAEDTDFRFEDIFFVEDGGHANINGRFIKSEDGEVFLDGGMDVNDGGYYVHARDSEADVPDANWNEGSTIEFTGLIDDDPSGANRDFYNVIFDNENQVSNFDVGWGHTNNEIFGDVIVRNTGGNQLRMTWAGRNSGDPVYMDIGGSIIVEGENSEFTTTGSGDQVEYTVNIGGDLIVRDGGHATPSRGSGGMAVWNIYGDLEIDNGTLDDSSDHDMEESFTFAADTLEGGVPGQNAFVSDISYDGPVHFKVADSSGVNVLEGSEFVVEESFINEGIAEIEEDGELIFADGAVYDHAQDGGNVPSSVWEEGSTALFSGIIDNGPGNASQDFYNVVLDSPNNVSNNHLDMDGNTIYGDIDVLDTGSARLYLTNLEAFEDREITIMGDIYVDANAFTSQGTGSGESSVTIHQYGDITVDSGNFSIGRGSGPIVEWYMHEGDFIFNDGETQNSNPRSGSAFIFTGGHRQILDVSEDVNIQHLPVIVPEGGYLDVMESELEGSDIFQLADGGALATSHPDGFDAIDPDETSFSSDASYIFSGEERQETSFTMPLSVDTLTIDNEAGVDQSRDITVNGALKLLRGEFNNQFELTMGDNAELIQEDGYLSNPFDDEETHQTVQAEDAADQEGFDDYFEVVENEDEDYTYIQAIADSPEREEAPEDGHLEFNTTLSGEVNIWLLVNMADPDSDSFYIGYDDHDMVRWWMNYDDNDFGDATNYDYGEWVWVEYFDILATVQPQYEATGDNNLYITRRETGAKLDQILFTTDLDYQPEHPDRDVIVSADDDEQIADVPEETELNQNYPNPFNPTTSIEYALDADQQVTLEVYNTLGQHVTTLVDGQQSAGTHTAQFDGSDLPSGMYLYRLQTEDVVQTRKMMLVK